MTSNIVLSNTEYRVVGSRPIRHDGTDKVTGRARYGADIILPDLLYAKVLRSPHAHARIKSHRLFQGPCHAWRTGSGDLKGPSPAFRQGRGPGRRRHA